MRLRGGRDLETRRRAVAYPFEVARGKCAALLADSSFALSMDHRRPRTCHADSRPGKPAAPAVKEAVTDALERIRAAGRSAGVLATDPGYIEDCRAAGANFVGVGIDVTVYAAAIRELATRYRGDRGDAR